MFIGLVLVFVGFFFDHYFGYALMGKVVRRVDARLVGFEERDGGSYPIVEFELADSKETVSYTSKRLIPTLGPNRLDTVVVISYKKQKDGLLVAIKEQKRQMRHWAALLGPITIGCALMFFGSFDLEASLGYIAQVLRLIVMFAPFCIWNFRYQNR
jgi:hypothetical protein